MITKVESKELLVVLNFYLIGGVLMGIVAATVAVGLGGALARSDYGLPISAKGVTAIIVVFIGVLTSLLAFCVLLPAELKIIRRKLGPKLLAERLSRGKRKEVKRKQ